MKIHTLSFEGPFGPLTLEANEISITKIRFGKNRRPDSPNAVLLKARRQLTQYFSGKRTRFELPYSFETGTEFQRQVWQALAHVPFGKLTTYAEIAKRAKRPSAVRAVGNALGKNPLPILLPCHRVVQTGMRLGGFTGGTSIKRCLLGLEKSDRLIRRDAFA